MKTLVLAGACLVALSFGCSALATEPAGNEFASDLRAGLNVAAMAKVAVAEQYMQNGKWPDSNDAAGFVAPAGTPADIAIGQNGAITITYRAPESIAGKSLVLTPSAAQPGTIHWTCRAVGIPSEALPAPCK